MLAIEDGSEEGAGEAIVLAADATTSSCTAPEEPVGDEHPATATSTATSTANRCFILYPALY